MASESGLLFVERVHEERADFHLTENRASKIAKLVRNIPRPGMIEKAAEFFRQHQGSIDALTQEVASKAGSVGQTAATRGRELLGRTKEVAAILLNQSAMLMENRELDEAEAKCREALEIYRRADDDRGVATTLRQLGNIAFAQRHFGRAVTLLTAAHECLHRLHDPEALAVRVDLEMAQRAAGNASQGSQGATDQALGPESAP
jgi:tetratricopeptide (TPR) repeat protein